MTTSEARPVGATAAQRARLAYVYVRQSSVSQVLHHAESTDLQYGLVHRAVQLGWPSERVVVIDEDLGKSGGSSDERRGFQRLIAEIGLGHVGLVVSLDASRLARNNADWHRLLELCGLFGTLLADAERVYDPQAYHDRLLLGLSGIMSEAELHALKLRLQAGARHKAARGQLRRPLPAGLSYQPDGQIGLDPDEEVQGRLRLVFTLFAEHGSARAVVRALQQAQLPLPTRPLRGPAPHPVVWDAAQTDTVLAILHNPAYAGAYVYGRADPTSAADRGGAEPWPVRLLDHHPGYLTWETFVANQARLAANQLAYARKQPGTPRSGAALLQGLAQCGGCGATMRLHYGGRSGEYPCYVCRHDRDHRTAPVCQTVRTESVDAAVEQAVLTALAPDQVALAVAAVAELERAEVALHQQWQRRLERARYDATRVQRQYAAAEPENRLVARTLETQWETALRAVEALEQAYHTWQQRQSLVLTAEHRAQLQALAEDLPTLWAAPSTTAADRKQLIRLLIESVVVDGRRRTGHVWLQINWRTGARTELTARRRVYRYEEHADYGAIETQVRAWHGEGLMDEAIAARLNAAGLRAARGPAFTAQQVHLLRKRWGLATWNPVGPTPAQWPDGTYSLTGAAEVLGVRPGTVRRWLRRGLLTGQPAGIRGHWHIPLPVEERTALEDRLTHTRRPTHSKSPAA